MSILYIKSTFLAEDIDARLSDEVFPMTSIELPHFIRYNLVA